MPSDDDEDEETMEAAPDSQFCAGALLVMESMEQPNQIMRIAERTNQYDAAKLDRSAPVCKSLVAFADHHGDEEDEQECCHIVNEGCLAPAGLLIGGTVVPVDPDGEVSPCPACGEPTCEECMVGEVCFYCSDENV